MNECQAPVSCFTAFEFFYSAQNQPPIQIENSPLYAGP
jgi:hypothetical protein